MSGGPCRFAAEPDRVSGLTTEAPTRTRATSYGSGRTRLTAPEATMSQPTLIQRPTADTDFHLARLRRFAQLVGVADASHVAPWRRLARRAPFSSYLDCVALGRSE